MLTSQSTEAKSIEDKLERQIFLLAHHFHDKYPLTAQDLSDNVIEGTSGLSLFFLLIHIIFPKLCDDKVLPLDLSTRYIEKSLAQLPFKLGLNSSIPLGILKEHSFGFLKGYDGVLAVALFIESHFQNHQERKELLAETLVHLCKHVLSDTEARRENASGLLLTLVWIKRHLKGRDIPWMVESIVQMTFDAAIQQLEFKIVDSSAEGSTSRKEDPKVFFRGMSRWYPVICAMKEMSSSLEIPQEFKQRAHDYLLVKIRKHQEDGYPALTALSEPSFKPQSSETEIHSLDSSELQFMDLIFECAQLFKEDYVLFMEGYKETLFNLHATPSENTLADSTLISLPKLWLQTNFPQDLKLCTLSRLNSWLETIGKEEFIAGQNLKLLLFYGMTLIRIKTCLNALEKHSLNVL